MSTVSKKDKILKAVRFRMYLIFYILLFSFFVWIAFDWFSALETFSIKDCLLFEDGSIYRVESRSKNQYIYELKLIHKINRSAEKEGDLSVKTLEELRSLKTSDIKCP